VVERRPYRALVGAKVRAEWSYRTSFFTFLTAQATVTFLDCVAILVIFGRVPTIGGWDRGEVLVLYVATVLAFGLSDVLIAPVESTARYVLDGGFDRLLVRPLRILPQLLAAEFALRRFGRFVQASLVLSIGVATGAIVFPGAGRAAFLVPAVVGAAVSFGAISVLANSVAFWVPNGKEIANTVTYGGEAIAERPTHVYPRWLQRAALYVVPVGAVVYLPGIFVTDAPNPLGVPVWVQVTSPLLGVPLCGLAAFAWRAGLRRYEGAGS
jgi:ABC-2 type transport system permease protein